MKNETDPSAQNIWYLVLASQRTILSLDYSAVLAIPMENHRQKNTRVDASLSTTALATYTLNTSWVSPPLRLYGLNKAPKTWRSNTAS